MRKGWIAGLVAGTVFAVAAPASAQAYRDVLVRQMDAVTANLSEKGYRPDRSTTNQEFVVGVLDDGATVGLEVTLTAGRHYAIVGFCDQDCGDLDLALTDTSMNVLYQDEAEDDYPVLEFDAPRGDRFVVMVKMYDCSTEPCGFAYQVFRK